MSETTEPRDPKTTVAEPEYLQQLSDWIVEQGLSGQALTPLVEGFCDRLADLDLPVMRMHTSMATLHPTLMGFGGIWWRDRGFEAEDYERSLEHEESWRQSPLRTMIEGEIPAMRRRLRGPGAVLDFPVLEEFRAQGGTDWVARLVRFGGSEQAVGIPGMSLSWVSDRPEGFTDREIGMLDRLVPRLGLACYRITLQRVAADLLAAYLGEDAGCRVLAGQIERGAAKPLFAVIFYADLRGFTRVADMTPGERLLPALNAFLGDLTDLIEAHGGEVLKFMGDGLLAIFSLEGRDRGAVCAEAMATAEETLRSNAALNRGRWDEGEPPLELDIALHLGELMYGNVGSPRRLDFTVIGPAVNEASRIEALCEPLGCPLLVSASFARALGRPLRSIGSHRLRGVAEPQELFTRL